MGIREWRVVLLRCHCERLKGAKQSKLVERKKIASAAVYLDKIGGLAMTENERTTRKIKHPVIPMHIGALRAWLRHLGLKISNNQWALAYEDVQVKTAPATFMWQVKKFNS